jgi:hypothetical protein
MRNQAQTLNTLQNQSSKPPSVTAAGQKKNNKTIQLFMQELFDEKAPTSAVDDATPKTIPVD